MPTRIRLMGMTNLNRSVTRTSSEGLPVRNQCPPAQPAARRTSRDAMGTHRAGLITQRWTHRTSTGDGRQITQGFGHDW